MARRAVTPAPAPARGGRRAAAAPARGGRRAAGGGRAAASTASKS